MITFKQFFKESVDPVTRDRIPVLDGQREVYVTKLDINGYDTGLYVPKLYRMNSLQIEDALWDVERRVLYNTTDFNQFIGAITTVFERYVYNRRRYRLYDTLKGDINYRYKIYNEIEPLQTIIGTYKIVQPYDHENALYIGIEVDINAYSGVSHAADDLSGF